MFNWEVSSLTEHMAFSVEEFHLNSLDVYCTFIWIYL